MGLRSRVEFGEAELRRRASERTTQSFRPGCRGRGRLDMLITRAVHACKVVQSCLILCDPMDRKNLQVLVHGILQARILEWVAMPSSRGSSQPQGSNPRLSPLPAVAGGFLTTCATWEAQSSGLVNGGEPRVILSPVF